MRFSSCLFILLLALASCGEKSPSDESTTDEILSETDQNTMIQKGQVLFSTNCKICHSLDENAVETLGPILDSIKHHWPKKNILNAYIKNAPAMMQQNERSKKVYQGWKDKPQMPAFTGLNVDEIDCIIEFLYSNT